MVDAFLVLMQVGRDGDWTDRGVPEVVTGYGKARGPRAAALQWLTDNYPNAIGDDWQLLVWTGLRDKPYLRDAPTVVVKPMELRALNAGFRAHGYRRQALRTSPVTEKVPATALDLGSWILVTQDRRNAALTGDGPWFLADAPGPDAVAVRITGTKVMNWRGEDKITLITPVGELPTMPAGQPVIPADES
jgi:hypothetical protein